MQFIFCLVLVQPRKTGTHPDMTEKLLTGMKSIYKNKSGPDSSVGIASTFGAGGHGFESWTHYTKGVKNGTSSSMLTLA